MQMNENWICRPLGPTHKKSSDPPNLENARSLYRFQPTAPRRNGPRNVGACSGDAELLLLGGFVILSVAKEPGRRTER